jgi:hypothetical protein
MTADERQELNRLCAAVQKEQDPTKLTAILEQLNDFLRDRELKLIQFSKGAQGSPPRV